MKWNFAPHPTLPSLYVVLTLLCTLYQAVESNSSKNIFSQSNPGPQQDAIHLTALDTYLRRPDDVYRWHDTGHRIKGILPRGPWEGAVLNFTSQQWLTPEIVSCSVWTHNLVVITPQNLQFTHTGFLLIGGGKNDGGLPSSVDQLLLIAAGVAVETGSQAAVLYQVPNQPCTFADDPLQVARTEDEIIAYTWRHFVDRWNDTDWPLRLPMTKAAARALDTWQAFSTLQFGSPVEGFVVGGASKRGWTAWTLAAVDGVGGLAEDDRWRADRLTGVTWVVGRQRVVGLVPMVMDALHFGQSMHHYFRALGGWPFAFQPYFDLGLTTEMDSEGMRRMMDIIDPYSYLERLTMPKLIIVASNDEFFMMDDSVYYWKELRGEKHLLILANVEHSLLSGIPKVAQKPSRIIVWVAHTPKDSNRRDFRFLRANDGKCSTRTLGGGALCLQPILFLPRPVQLLGVNGGRYEYIAKVEPPTEGYVAFFAEVHMNGPRLHLPYISTTEVVISPDTFPFPDCSGVGCKGTLV